jgi:hypothetical protein
MRYIATQTSQYGSKQVLLVEHPQDERYRGHILSFVRIEKHDGPPEGGQVYEGFTMDQLFQEFEDDYEIKRTDWTALPDQIRGCEDGWVDPVRPARDDQQGIIPGTWERLVGDQWLRFQA